MAKKLFFALLAATLLVSASISSALSAAPTSPPTVEWSWLQKQVASGAKEVTLTGNVQRGEDEEGLAAEGTVTIHGKGFTITGALVDGGTVIFQDVALSGVHGVGDEDGGAALTLRGEGSVAVLSGATRAIGGRSGVSGERGGDGVLLTGDKQGVLLRNRAYVQGGAGHLLGGSGVRVEGCAGSILLADSAASMGGIGLADGGAGLNAPSCAKVQLRNDSTAIGGASVYTGGNGVLSPTCTVCAQRQGISIEDKAMLTSGIGEAGGNAANIERENTPGGTADLSLAGDCTLIGGAGGTAGSAIRATNASLSFAGNPALYSGDYLAKNAPVLDLTGCETFGDLDAASQNEGAEVDKHPASDMSMILNMELSQISDRFTPTPIENGLMTRELLTKLSGLSVEKGRVSRVTLAGGLKINLWNATLEKRIDFTQRLDDDGAEGVRLVLIASSSEHWVTLEAAVTSLQKLLSLGVTQIAYTSVEPVYCERIIDLAALLEAVEANEVSVDRVFLGTADDCVIFQHEGGERVYQEDLMKNVRRML